VGGIPGHAFDVRRALLVALLLAACSGGDAESKTAGPVRQAAPTTGTSVHVAVGAELEVSPEEVAPGEAVRAVLRNVGSEPFETLNSYELGHDVDGRWETLAVDPARLEVVEVAPGDEVAFEVATEGLAPGEWAVTWAIRSTRDQGSGHATAYFNVRP